MSSVFSIQAMLSECRLDAILITDEKNQRYATRFPITDGAVLISTEGAWMITDSRYIEAASTQADKNVEVLLYNREHSLTARLKELIAEHKLSIVAAEDMALSHGEYLKYEKALGMSLAPAGDFFVKLRGSKTEQEIASMIAAQRISEKAFEAVLQVIRPGMSERELMAVLVYEMLKNGSEGNSFDPIVVTGSKTSMPHGIPGDQIIKRGDFVTMDFGCLKDGYCSDMTRTVAVGEVTDEMKNVYDTVLRAQLAGISVARAGVLGRDIDATARKVITDAGYGEYFGHGFGHSLGLDIHEMPSPNPSGNTPMPLNSVCSAEPGIYLPGKFGVRIEDVMILRTNCAEVITRAEKSLIVL